VAGGSPAADRGTPKGLTGNLLEKTTTDDGSARGSRLREDLASLRLDREPPPPRSSRGGRRLRRVVVPLLLLGALGAAFAAWRTRPVPVEVALARKAEPGSERVPLLSGSGYVVTGDRYVSIGVRVPGRIERYFVEEGQAVRKGDALVALDDRDYRAALRRSEAALVLARANAELAANELRRGDALRRSGVLSAQEYDVLRNKARVTEATIDQLEAEIAQARVNLEYTTLRAPTDGVVLAKLKEVGEIAVPGGFSGSGDLIRIANLSDLRAEVDVNEADLQRVRMGGPAEVVPDAYPDARYPARVVKLYPQVDRQKGTLKVEVGILEPDARLLPDMSARVSFLPDPAPTGAPAAAPAVLVPAAAVRREGAESFVWVVREGRARRVRIETSGETGSQARVVSGLSGGESVVVGDAALREGARVEPGAET